MDPRKGADGAPEHSCRCRRGIWQPPKPQTTPVRESSDPTFHEFASEWFEGRKDSWRRATRLDYEWQLSKHLLPFFKGHRLSQITVQEVDRFRTVKTAEAAKIKAKPAEGKPIMDEYTDRRGCRHRRPKRALSVTSINKMLTRLAQILDQAVEYELIGRNPAKGRSRRLKPVKPAPVWLDSAEQIGALLGAAGELDREARAGQRAPRRAILSTLVFTGMRIGELIELRWRDATHKACVTARSDERVFPTRRGGAMNDSNVRNRILDTAVARANERLEASGSVPLPEGLTPHKLRHTYTSLLAALGTDLGAMMDLLGHTDPGFTLRVYRHSMRRDPESRAQLRALVGVDDLGTGEVSGTISGTNRENEQITRTAGSNGRQQNIAV